MITELQCVNISSKDPKALAEFYQAIGAPVFVGNERYDGWHIGDREKGGTVCVWDENRWGKSSGGYATVVFNSDDVEKTYAEIKGKGFAIDPPKTAVWGGRELVFHDPDGNQILIL